MAALPSVDEIARIQGLTVRKVLKEDYDHNIYAVDRGGEELILKTINDPKLAPGFEREIAYSMLVAALARSDPSWTMRGSMPVATGTGWMLREVVEGEPLLDVRGPYPDDAVHRLGAALADLDRLSPDPRSRKPSYRNGAGEPVEDEAHRLSELERWVGALRERGGVEDADELMDGLRRGRQDLLAGMEVWDTKLEEFIGTADGKVALFDLEFAHLFGRRHYDAARLYASLAVHGTEAGVAGRLLTAYVESSCLDSADVLRAAVPVLAETLLAEAYDALPEEGKPRKPGFDRALTLLRYAVAGDTEALLQA